jgi:hypothetical protein
MKNITALVCIIALTTGPAWADVVEFGDDSSEWANDGECDDARFLGAGMAPAPLLFEDVETDATDCSTAFYDDTINLRGVSLSGQIDFGDDSSEWANDGECDDMRFVGEAMTSTPLNFEDIMADASDCRMGFEVEALFLR